MENTNQDSTEIGRLTPEEQQALLKLKQDSNQILNKIGEFEVMKARLLGKLDEMDREGQAIMGAIAQRLEIQPGQQWGASLDGPVRLVTTPEQG